MWLHRLPSGIPGHRYRWPDRLCRHMHARIPDPSHQNKLPGEKKCNIHTGTIKMLSIQGYLGMIIQLNSISRYLLSCRT